MSEMQALSALYEESNDLQMDEIAGENDLQQMEVGGAGREPSPNPSRSRAAPLLEEEGPMEEEGAQPMVGPQGGGGLAQRPIRGEQPGQVAGPDLDGDGEELDDWEDDYDYPEEQRPRGASYRASAAREEAHKMFLRPSGAAEAARDGGFRVRYEKTPFDQLAFIEELFSLMVVNSLTEELGCDEIIEKE